MDSFLTAEAEQLMSCIENLTSNLKILCLTYDCQRHECLKIGDKKQISCFHQFYTDNNHNKKVNSESTIDNREFYDYKLEQ